jgi:hypothetical protein
MENEKKLRLEETCRTLQTLYRQADALLMQEQTPRTLQAKRRKARSLLSRQTALFQTPLH